MKANIQIQRGWRRLRVGEIIRKGDREYVRGIPDAWKKCDYLAGAKKCRLSNGLIEYIIRKLARKGGKGK